MRIVNKKPSASILISSLLLSLSITFVALAQVPLATISGVVKDSTGAVIPGSEVIARHVATGTMRTVRSDDAGRYRLANLALGNYEVEASFSGFQTEVRSGIELTLGREAQVNFTLRPGEVTERVTVTGEAPLVNTTSASVGQLVSETQVESLPLNGRSLDQLAILQPGVIFGRYKATSNYRGANEKMSIGGARFAQNLFLLDGTDINDSRNRTPGSVSGRTMGVEALQEFRIETNSYSAEFGSGGGGVVIMATKAGTNQFHGSVYEYHRNDNLDARNFFDGKKQPEFKRNQYGFSLGGPVRKNKTFFFGNYEALRERLGTTNVFTVPNDQARQGFLPDPSTKALINLGVDPVVKPYLELYPRVNGRDFGDGTGEHINAFSNPTDEDYFTVRMDHQFSDNHSLFGRYTFSDGEQLSFGGIEWLPTGLRSRNQYVTIEEKAILSPQLLNSARIGFSRSFSIQEQLRLLELPSSLDFIPGRPVFTDGYLRVTPLIDLSVSRTPIDFVTNKYQFGDDVVYIKGRHSFKFGGAYQRHQYNLQYEAFRGGEYEFGALRDFIFLRPAGTPVRASSLRLELSPVTGLRGWRQSLIAAYIQDDFRVRDNFTLNLGVRYETMTAASEVNGIVTNLDHLFDPTERQGGTLFPNKTKLQFAPRVGLAWDVTGNGTTALRAGFGIFYNNITPDEYYGAGRDQPPYSNATTVRNVLFPNGLGEAQTRGVASTESRPITVTGASYTIQQNFSVERQLGGGLVVTAGYVGSQGRRLIRTVQENIAIPQILADGRKFFAPGSVRRRTDRGNVRRQISDSNSSYNGFTLNVRRRFGDRFQVQGTYTYAKSLSDADSIEGNDVVGDVLQTMDPENRTLDRSLSAMDIRHNMAVNYSYGLPIPVASGLAGKLLGGWQLGGIIRISSGSPFTVKFSRGGNWSNDQSSGSSIFDRPNWASGRNMHNTVLGGPDRYFDATAFDPGPRGFYGNVPRNALIAPGLINFDLSLQKNTSIASISENFELQFRAEFFNAFNRVNFGAPVADAIDNRGNTVGSAGRIGDTATTARQIQLGLKVVF